jgi:hypothetical protein
LAIALCGLRIAFGHKPWLPAFVLNRRVSYAVLEKMVHFGCRIYEKVEKVVRPRLGFLLAGPGMGMLIGLAIALSGIFLSLPIPPPFPLTNTIPGFAIIFLSLGGEMEDSSWLRVDARRAIYIALIGLAGTGSGSPLANVWGGELLERPLARNSQRPALSGKMANLRSQRHETEPRAVGAPLIRVGARN